MFSEKELSYLKSQRLARIATVSADGEPDVAPVGFTFERRFLVGGMDLKRTLKYRTSWPQAALPSWWTIFRPQILHSRAASRSTEERESLRPKAILAGRSTSKSPRSAIGVGVLTLLNSKTASRR
jgi:Pyridoxamine 5'-phosphate oxidase